MAFNSNEPTQEYIAGDGQTIFTYLFKIFIESNIEVWLTPVDTGVPEKLSITLDYTVTINGDDGGTVTLVNPATAGDGIQLNRVLELSRFTEYQTSGDLLASTLNQDQEYQTYLIGDQAATLDRSILLPSGVTGLNNELPLPAAEEYIRWNAAGTALENDAIIPDAAKESALRAWDSEAEAMTAESYATQPQQEYVIEYSSNDDGTFTPTETLRYSALHWAFQSDGTDKVSLGGDTMTGLLTLSGDPTDALHAVTKQYADALHELSKHQAGVLFDFAGTSAPSGALECNGQVLSQATYPELYAVLGSTWDTTGGVASPGAGNFRLPPQQIGNIGVFSRGAGSTNGPVGTYQGDVTKTHTHTGTASASGSHSHTYSTNNTTRQQGTYNATPIATLLQDVASKSTSTAGSHSHTLTVASTGDATETRPRAITVLKCIWTGQA